MKLNSLTCLVVSVLSLALSGVVGCAAPAAEEASEGASADLSDGTYDPTVTSPVAWACNFQDGTSTVFVQERVHSAYGTLSSYAGLQDPRADFAALQTGSGQEALETTKVKFQQIATDVIFTAVEEEGAPVAMNVAQDESLKIGSRIFPWTARLPESKVLGGCWGVR